MSDDLAPRPKNQETDPRFNAEPGLSVTPGSNFHKEMLKFEQFPHSRFALGWPVGNPYVKREYPKMIYKADRYNGAVVCMAAPPDPHDYADPRAYERAEEAAKRFTEKCQRIVQDEREHSKARESGWRDHPDEAVAFIHERDRNIANAAATRNYEDRNLSEAARREVAAAEAAHDGHLAEVPRKRGRPRKNPAA